MKPSICSRCHEEVRHGTRAGVTGWLHRADVDHATVLGYLAPPEERARWEAELDVPRYRVSSAAAKRCPTYQGLWPLEEYTVRGLDLERYRKSKKFREAEEREAASNTLETDEDEALDSIPAPEVAQHDVDIDSFPPRSGIRQILNLITRTDGWELRRLTASRGPYMGSTGKVLSISDAVVMGARGPMLDSGRAVAVASWRDGAFDFAYTGILNDGVVTTTAANSTALKAWIKENSHRDRPTDPVR